MSLWVSLYDHPDSELFDLNITHNLTEMAKASRLYTAIWHPDHMQAVFAMDIVETLQQGLDYLLANRAEMEQFNPANGWGDYDTLVSSVKQYLAACERHPEARISAHG